MAGAVLATGSGVGLLLELLRSKRSFSATDFFFEPDRSDCTNGNKKVMKAKKYGISACEYYLMKRVMVHDCGPHTGKSTLIKTTYTYQIRTHAHAHTAHKGLW